VDFIKYISVKTLLRSVTFGVNGSLLYIYIHTHTYIYLKF
jgi:hypothetical protein